MLESLATYLNIWLSKLSKFRYTDSFCCKWRIVKKGENCLGIQEILECPKVFLLIVVIKDRLCAY